MRIIRQGTTAIVVEEHGPLDKHGPERGADMATTRKRDTTQRRWVITCRRGTWVTWSMKRGDAELVAEWANLHHPHCGPHVVVTRERRTWAQRKGEK